MAVIDEGGGGPTLSPKAKHFERQLFKIFSSSTSTIWLTQDDWRGAKTQLEDLAKDVDKVRAELQAPPDGGKGWTGPAAEAALSSLAKLSATLDGHAAKVGDVDTSLGQVYTAITDAKSAWYSEVASISTYVDPSEHTLLPPPHLRSPLNTSPYSVPDPEAAAAAEDALWEKRNQAAKRVLDQLGADTQTATATMPIESKTDTETPYSNQGPGGGGGDYPTGTQTPSSSGGYQGQVRPVFTGGLVQDGDGDGTDTGDDVDLGPDQDEPTDIVTIGDPEPPNPDIITIGDPEPLNPGLDLDLDPISSDGDVTGTIGTNPTGGPTPAGMQAPGGGGGGIGAGGLAAGGLGAGAAGVGGILGARGRGFGGAGAPGGGRGGTTGGRTGGAAGGRGGTAPGAAGGARGGATMVPGGGTSGQSRAGASGRGSAVKGASGSGRYGVPKLDGRSSGMVPAGSNQAAKAGGGKAGARGPAGRGAAGAVGRGGSVVAGGGGGARKGDASKDTDVDKLTHEDEDTWYDGTDESSPQVWD